MKLGIEDVMLGLGHFFFLETLFTTHFIFDPVYSEFFDIVKNLLGVGMM